MRQQLIDSLSQAETDLHIHRAGDPVFDALAQRFSTHPGVEVSYVVAVRPGDAEAVRHAAASAHRHGAGLLTVFNQSDVGAQLHGSGDTVVLDLSRLDRVLEVNVANGYARVEPGVSYASLSVHLAENGQALQVDSERDGNASIAGSTFAKGIGYTPYGEHGLVQCGAEFALPYGDLMRTGMGAMPGSRTWQVYKYALGPYSDGLAMQSGLLIPTQIGVWLMGQVSMTQILGFEVANSQALGAVIEMLREFKIGNVLPGTVSLTHRTFDEARHPPDVAAAEWRLTTGLYGHPNLIAPAKTTVDGALLGIAGVRAVSAEEQAASPAWQEQAALVSGQSGGASVTFPGIDASRVASLTLVAPIEDRFALAMERLGKQALAAHGLPFLNEMAVVGRALLQKVYLPYTPDDVGSVQRLAVTARQLVAAMQQEGIGVAAQSFELAGIGLGRDTESGLAELHRKIEMALTA